MGQIVIPVPAATPNAMSNILGVLGAIGVLLQSYLKTGTVSIETVAIAVFIAAICYFIGKKDPTVEAQLVNTVQGIVDSTISAKLPAAITAARPVNALESALVDTAASQNRAGS